MIGLETLALVAGLGGAVNLDRTALVQSMASRPLVGATVGGFLMGNAPLGLLCGALIELLWLMDLPVGASVPPDEALAGVLAAVFAVATPEAWSVHARAGIGVLAALPFGVIGRWVDLRVRRWNGGLVDRVRQRLGSGESVSLARSHWTGTVRFFGAGAANTALGTGVALWGLGPALAEAPPWVPAAAELVETMLPVFGAAAMLAALRGRVAWALFGGGLAAGFGVPRFSGGFPWRP